MEIPLYQVDAFARAVFHGNPAAVCPLDRWLPDPLLQSIAAENNLAETAFYVPEGPGRYHIRWFTPVSEIDLCGHATVASAAVILGIRREMAGPRVVFSSQSGDLMVDHEDGLYVLNFPSRPPRACPVPPALIAALGAKPASILAARDYFCVFETEEQVRSLVPDMRALAGLDRFAVIATAPGSDCDFVSRFFAPAKGVPEDPVTGSAHTSLIPYWSQRLGKTQLFARQISARGGELWCEYLPQAGLGPETPSERVRIGGRAVHYLTGKIILPDA